MAAAATFTHGGLELPIPAHEKEGDPRINRIVCSSKDTARIAACRSSGLYIVRIIGYPHDEGVRRNQGRPGAAGGPASFRKKLGKLGSLVNPELGLDLGDHVLIVDDGDVDAGLALEEAHEALHARVALVLKDGDIPFVIGGGNDQSFPNGRAFLEHFAAADAPVGVVNVDAHLDVRPLVNGLAHSGSPFRQLLELPKFAETHSRLVVFAAQGFACSQDHVDFVEAHNGEIVWLGRDLRAAAAGAATPANWLADRLDRDDTAHVFFSFDLDSIDSSWVPGVSAQNAAGLTGPEALDLCLWAGANPKVKMVDMSEFNPLVEEDRSLRVIAELFYTFVVGVARRHHEGSDF